jgi:hypothetical protein
VIDDSVCTWCHNFTGLPEEYNIRICERCHGLDSLHNIAADSDTGCFSTDPSCEVVVGGEAPGYSHVGNDGDCWGCHGFAQSASAPGSGPVTPSISSSDALVITAGNNAPLTLTGAAFTNLIGGVYQWTSDVLLTDADGNTVTLTPERITQGSLALTIPGTMPTGNYSLQAVKGSYAASNPVVISIKPDVVITNVTSNGATITITGSGFGDAPPEGAEEYLNVKMDGVALDIISWTPTEIVATDPGAGAMGFSASADETFTVSALFCEATFTGGSEDNCDNPCVGNFDGDGDVDGTDAFTFKAEFGRIDCSASPAIPCKADLDCDGDVDGTDSFAFKQGFGREQCPDCPVDECSY